MKHPRLAASVAAVVSTVVAAAGDAAAQAPAGSGAIDSIDLSTLALSLAVIVAVIFAAGYVVRRLPLGFAARGTGPLKLVATLPLGPRERLMLVTSRGREILVGVSPAGVSIAQVDPMPAGAGHSPASIAVPVDAGKTAVTATPSAVEDAAAASLARRFAAEDATR